MNKSDSTGALFAALAKAQGEMSGARKDSENPHFKSAYADLASVWDACREPLAKNALAVIQTPGTDEHGLYVETTLGHSSGEWITTALYVTPVKNDPQGIGSAITYARRYSLAAIVGVAPEDDDGEGAMGRGPSQRTSGTKAPPRGDNTQETARERQSEAAGEVGNWRDVRVHFGKNGPQSGKPGTALKMLSAKQIAFYREMMEKKRDGKSDYPASKDDLKLLAACEMALMEIAPQPGTRSAHAPQEPDELPMSDGTNVRKLAERLEWAGHTKEDFIKVGLMSKWIDADAWHKLSDDAAAGALADFNDTVLPALDTHKKGAGK